MRIKSPLKIIKKDGLVEFDIVFINGGPVLKTKKFKQNLKGSEYEAIMANQVEPAKKIKVEPAKKIKAETKKQKEEREKKEADAKAKEEADAEAKAGEQAPPVDEEPAI